MKNSGYFFLDCIKHALTKGVEDYAKDSNRRQQFVSISDHLIAGTYLVAMFSYLESTLSDNWIDRHGGRHKRDLECLKFVRDGFVHKNSHLRDLGSHTPTKEQALRDYIADLQAGSITDDNGNIFPCYLDCDSDLVVEFNEDAIQILSSLAKAISH